MIAQALSVFFAFIVLDVVWARYMIALSDRKVRSACLWSMVIPLLSGWITVQYVDNNWMLIPAALGAGVGTWLAMRIK